MPYTRIHLEQGTAAWLAWRRGGIGASEAPAIMRENPWKSGQAVLAEKCGLSRGDFHSPAMAFGTATEPEARNRYTAATGIDVSPACVQSIARPWLRASLDGLSPDGQFAVEIKCGERALTETARHQRPPRYYVGQLQHILAVTGLPTIDLWCFLPGRPPVRIGVARDEAYIARMLLAEEVLWAEVLAFRARRATPCVPVDPEVPCA